MTRDIKEILRAGDPAADDPGLTRPEAAAMKRAILDGALSGPSAAFWAPMLAGGTLALVVLFVLLKVEVPDGTQPGRAVRDLPADANVAVLYPEARAQDPGTVVPARRPVRRIDFVTQGGTRVLWTLDPDFDV